MSNVRQEGNDPYAGWGPSSPTVAPPGLGSFITTFPLVPAPAEDIRLDTSQEITMEVWVGGGLAGQVYVTPTLLVDGDVLANGEELSGTFVNGDLIHFGWDLTPRLATIPAGAEVVWEFQLSGAFDSAYYWMEDDLHTFATLPVVAPSMAPDPGEEQGSADPTTSTAPAPSSSSSTTSRPPASTQAAGIRSATSTSASLPAAGGADAGDAPSDSKDAPSLPAVLVVTALAWALARRRHA